MHATEARCSRTVGPALRTPGHRRPGEGVGAFKVCSHGVVAWITGILLVHHASHPFQRGPHQGLINHAPTQPLGDVLGRDAQGCPVFHQPGIVDVRHFRAASTPTLKGLLLWLRLHHLLGLPALLGSAWFGSLSFFELAVLAHFRSLRSIGDI